ncbi:hypothetical protein EDI_336680 [Entamoeba dispar SAW760]|uniref:Uncharacterized protein n=1 Tax=Entamoeba dispar (strain ATCC PRA-260 / SAW760) TaxID=370354 RepID=B0ERX3_ENTDS|nr:uncharacterized protein EDI_336680 [Entamoeba dispar SAW760]EDR22768.1 hypothetical protein EDI_336680 [Entamoeba dispar SAW760]|eukprot:EDR22768.1 hypothetical protein EDI_336680 [Entamoeba dispar SAW760]
MENKGTTPTETQIDVEGKKEYERQRQLLEGVQTQIRTITQMIAEESTRLNLLQEQMTKKIEEIHSLVDAHPLNSTTKPEDESEEEGYDDDDSWDNDDIIWDYPISQLEQFKPQATEENSQEKKPKLLQER